jgi:ubiquinol-cytochrome c reductase cytochrome b subunit
MPLRKNNSLLSIGNNSLIDLPSPTSLSYMWNFGSLLGLCLVIQFITGIFLAMYYSSDSSIAFNSVIHIMRDINFGWLIKLTHANGASLFFFCVYFHIARGIYYGSYLKIKLWYSGIIIFVIMMAIAFLGYVLPWGQMSFWGATVITNFFSAIPIIGDKIVLWLWGGFSVGKATLSRFYSFHYLLPFILASLIIIHLIFLHEGGSNNPNGIGLNLDKINFHPYFIIKDLYGYFIIFILLSIIIFYYPNLLGDAENFIHSNPLVTPIHIIPEWYFLFAYAILRAIPNKLGGLLALILSLIILFFLPFFHSCKLSSLIFRPFGKFLFWLFIVNFILLTWLGSKVVEEPFVVISQLSSSFYFSYFFFFIPLIGLLENKILLNKYLI